MSLALVVINVVIMSFVVTGSKTDPNMVPIPARGYTHKSCVHNVSSFVQYAAHLEHDTVNGDVLIFDVLPNGRKVFKKRFGPCQHQSKNTNLTTRHGVAWKAWTEYEKSSSDVVTFLSGKWKVPQAPSSRGQLLYLWNGIEPHSGEGVLQPVMQYGSSAAGGGNFWGIASWYVSSDHGSYHTSLVEARTGDYMVGTVTLTGNSYSINGTVLSSGKSAQFSMVPKDGPYTWSCNTLEMYSLESCSQYPTDPYVVTDIKVELGGKAVTPTWKPMTKNPITCNEHATSNGPTDSTVHWNQS